MEDKSNFVILAIVAIVAIVSLVVLVNGPKANYMSSEISSVDQVGRAFEPYSSTDEGFVELGYEEFSLSKKDEDIITSKDGEPCKGQYKSDDKDSEDYNKIEWNNRCHITDNRVCDHGLVCVSSGSRGCKCMKRETEDDW